MLRGVQGHLEGFQGHAEGVQSHFEGFQSHFEGGSESFGGFELSMGASRVGIIEHYDPIWDPKLIPNGVQSEICAETENRALAAAGALPEPGWRLQKRPFSRFSL